MAIVGSAGPAPGVAVGSADPAQSVVSVGTAGPAPDIDGAIAYVVRWPDELLYPSEWLWPGGEVVTGAAVQAGSNTGAVVVVSVTVPGAVE